MAIAVSFCLAHVNASPIVLATLTALFAWCAHGILNVKNALFSFAITAQIFFLLPLDGIPGPGIAERRIVCTLLGRGIAPCVRMVVIPYNRRRRRKAIAGIQFAVFSSAPSAA